MKQVKFDLAGAGCPAGSDGDLDRLLPKLLGGAVWMYIFRVRKGAGEIGLVRELWQSDGRPAIRRAATVG